MGIFDKLKKKKREEKLEEPEKDTSKKKEKALKEKPLKATKVKTRLESAAYRIIVRPLVSEKASFLAAENKHIFEVYKKATKKQIRQAIKDIYGIKPISVQIINIKGKQRRYGRATGRTSDRKKAIVTLPPGKTIKVYEGV